MILVSRHLSALAAQHDFLVVLLALVSAITCGFFPPFAVMLRYPWNWVANMHMLWTAGHATHLLLLQFAPQRCALCRRFDLQVLQAGTPSICGAGSLMQHWW